MKTILADLEKRFQVSDIKRQKDALYFITCEKEHTISLITYLRDIMGFSHLVLLTAVDWIEEGKFQLTYILNNPDKHLDLGVRSFINRENATMYSAHHLWEQVATYQRELREMFGIDFPGSPGVDKDFILEGWDNIPPYRRDFNTKKYSEETYFPRPGRESNDPAEYMKKNLYDNE